MASAPPLRIAHRVYEYSADEFTDAECTALCNLDEFVNTFGDLCALYYLTHARKSIDKLIELNSAVSVHRMVYLHRKEQGRPVPLVTRELLQNTARSVRCVRIPPTLSARRDEIEALRARLEALADAAHE